MNEKNKIIDFKSLVRPKIRDISAYHVEQVPCPVILDANESPHPLPEKLRERIWVVMAGTEFNRYPDMDTTLLRKVIAKKEGCEPNEALLGNGSDEIIQTIIETLCDPGETVLIPAPTFVMYKVIANFLSVACVGVPLQDDWTLDMDSMLDKIAETNPKVIFLASPNNPTGMQYSINQVKHIAEACSGIVVLDEAYVDYSDYSAGAIFKESPNIVVLKTLSKVGLAAIRLGYILGDARIIEQLNKVRLPYNINSVTQAVATEAIQNWGEIKTLAYSVAQERDRVYEALGTMDKVEPAQSWANFLLMKIGADPAKTFKGLLDRGVRVRWFKGAPRLDTCFRVTIGTPTENDAFLKALAESL